MAFLHFYSRTHPTKAVKVTFTTSVLREKSLTFSKKVTIISVVARRASRSTEMASRIRQQAEAPVLIRLFCFEPEFLICVVRRKIRPGNFKRQGGTCMNFLADPIRPIYFKYLAAAFGSALISSIYGVVDAAMVGQYQGPAGTATLAVVAPIWNIIYSLGLLTGIGGSVLFGTARGKSSENGKESNEYFTASVIGTGILALLAWCAVIFFDRQLLLLFGAEETLLPLARKYLFPIKFVVPSFLFTQMIAAFLRNDGDPALATKAVLFGGIFNVFGDYFFVFTLDMGIMGAGIATAMGSVFSLIIMLTHFFKKKNTLRPAKPSKLPEKLWAIARRASPLSLLMWQWAF